MLRMVQRVHFVTGNPGKLEEFLKILGSDYAERVVTTDIDLPELQGEPEEVSRVKCQLAAEKLKVPVVVEDTSLCFNALGGMPGPYIKWFLKSIGPDGLPKLLQAFEDKSAYALCIYAYSSGEPGSKIETFVGRCDGKIVTPRGPRNFGWDPVFQPDGFDQTYAEMSKEVKNSISHRGKAMNLLKEFLVKVL